MHQWAAEISSKREDAGTSRTVPDRSALTLLVEVWGKPKRRLSSEPAVFITDQTQPTASLLAAAVCFMKPMKPEESLLLQHEVCFAKVVLAKCLCAVLHPIEPAIMKPVCSTLILGRSYRQHCDPAMICPHAS